MSFVSRARTFVVDSAEWARENPGKILTATTVALAIIRAHRAEPTPFSQISCPAFKKVPDDFDEYFLIGTILLGRQ